MATLVPLRRDMLVESGQDTAFSSTNATRHGDDGCDSRPRGDQGRPDGHERNRGYRGDFRGDRRGDLRDDYDRRDGGGQDRHRDDQGRMMTDMTLTGVVMTTDV